MEHPVYLYIPGGKEAGGEGESAMGINILDSAIIRCEDIGECGAEWGKATGDPTNLGGPKGGPLGGLIEPGGPLGGPVK